MRFDFENSSGPVALPVFDFLVFFYLIVLFYIFINMYQVKSITWQPGRKDFAAIEVDSSIFLDSDQVIPICLPSSPEMVCIAKANCTSE